MKNPFRGAWQRTLLRPLIYMATNRFLAALALLLLYNRFLRPFSTNESYKECK